MILSHFTSKPFKFNPDRKYKERSTLPFKPKGLWLSDESDHGWKTWCEGEDWNTGALVYRTDFTVEDKSKLLILDTPEKIISFSDKYAMKEVGFSCTDWPLVQHKFDGILISPYQWTLRHSHRCNWYYSWDCASACVWNLSILKIVEPSSRGSANASPLLVNSAEEQYAD